LNHPFRSDKQSFLKGKTVRKGPPKHKLGADIKQMLDDVKHQKMIGSKAMAKSTKSTTGLIYVAFGNSLMHQH
jgi:hypothetical protein